MSDLDIDPYAAYYDFQPVHRRSQNPISGSKRAIVLHELGRAGSPCTDREWGTKVEAKCPACGATGKIVGWHGRTNFYSCHACDAVLSISY